MAASHRIWKLKEWALTKLQLHLHCKPVTLNFAGFILGTSTLRHPIYGLEVIVWTRLMSILWYRHLWSLKFDADTQKQRKLFERTTIPSFSESPCIKFSGCINGCFQKKGRQGVRLQRAEVLGWRASSASTARFAPANPRCFRMENLSQAIEARGDLQQTWSLTVLELKTNGIWLKLPNATAWRLRGYT